MNDNTETTTTTPITSDEQCLKDVINLLETRVSIQTGFIPDDETGFLTHQVLQISCGDFRVVSTPEQLELPLVPAPLPDTVTIN